MVDQALSPPYNALTKAGCILAFHGLVVDKQGTIMPCCQYAAGDAPPSIPWQHGIRYHEIIRQPMHDDMINDQPHKACGKCYKEESLGGRSLRLHANQTYGNRYQLNSDPKIYHLEIRAGNTCNLKCMMCWPGASSAIAAERYHYQDRFAAMGLRVDSPVPVHAWWKDEDFQAWFARVITNVQHLHFTGGEPFLIPDIVDMIDSAVERSPGIEIGFNTNLTVLTPYLMRSLRSVKRLDLSVSLEGIGAINNYVRFPSKWSEIDANLQTVRKELPHARVTCNHTVQHASVYGLPALMNYCQENDLDINFNLVQGHPDLSWDTVPPKDLERFKYWLVDHAMHPHHRSFLQQHCIRTIFDRSKHDRFRMYVGLLDDIRGTSWDDIFHPSVLT